MRAETTRNGFAESTHHTSAIAVDVSGRVLLSWGDPGRPYRSAIKAGHNGVGIATKAEDGSQWVSVMAMLEAMRRLGALSQTALDALDDVARPPVLGRERLVGRVETHVDD